jgi:hypothetical protein
MASPVRPLDLTEAIKFQEEDALPSSEKQPIPTTEKVAGASLELLLRRSSGPTAAAPVAATPPSAPHAMRTFKEQIVWEGRSYTVTAQVPASLPTDKIKQVFERSLGIVKSNDIKPGTKSFDLQFGIPKISGPTDGIIATIPDQISYKFNSDEAIALSKEIRSTTTIPAPSPIVSKPSPVPLTTPAPAAVPISAPSVSQPARIPLPHFANSNNNCFLTSTTWAFLLKDPLIRRELPNALAKANPTSNKHRALTILSDYLKACDQSAQTGEIVPPATVNSLRQALHLLSSKEFSENDGRQHDAEAALTCFTDAVLGHTKGENHLTTVSVFENGSKLTRNISDNGKLDLHIPLEEDKTVQNNASIANMIGNYLDSQGQQITHINGLITQQISVWDKPPERLEITLKRYVIDPKTREITKIIEKIPASETCIILHQHFTTEEDTTYRLVGAVCHEGNATNSGHYTAMVVEKDPFTNQPIYYFCNDQRNPSVVPSNEAAFLDFAANAYKLLYVKI